MIYKVGDKLVREYFPFPGYIVDIDGNREKTMIGQHGFKNCFVLEVVDEGYIIKDEPDIPGAPSTAQKFSLEDMKAKITRR